MSHHSKNGKLLAISEVIREVINAGYTTGVELAEVGQISDASIDRYKTDEAEPRCGTVQRWVHFHPNAEVRTAFKAWLTEGSPEVAGEESTPATGQVLHSLISLNGQVGSTLANVNLRLADGRCSIAEYVAGKAEFRALNASVQRTEALWDRMGTRHQAHAPKLVV